ncbi:MAG: ATPase P [Candidatus Limnocylindrales bacterium]
MRTIEIPDEASLQLDHLVLDVNGTLTERGELIDGVAERLMQVGRDLDVHLLTADTFGTASALGDQLGVPATLVRTGDDKLAFVAELGADATVAIGNGRNDAAMLQAARLGIVIIGPEGAAATTLLAADVMCRSVIEALDLLLDERSLIATLRA